MNLEKVTYEWVGGGCDINENKHFHLIYDTIKIQRKNKYIVSFNCISCNRENIVNLNNFVGKVEKNTKSCFNCNIFPNKFTSIDDKILKDRDDYFKLPLRKRIMYENKLMTPFHFEKIKKYIISYNNDKFSDIDYTMYIPYYKPTESNKHFEPCFLDRNTDIVTRAINIKLECHHCNYHFKIDSIRNIRKQFPIYCKMCYIRFGDIKPKYECNITGQNVMYKTKMQHKFIKYCNNNEIVIYNGPNNIELCNIDFYIPHSKTYIDVVGNLEYQEDYNVDNLNKRYDVIQDFISKETRQGLENTYIVLHPKNYVKEARNLWKLSLKIKPVIQ